MSAIFGKLNFRDAPPLSTHLTAMQHTLDHWHADAKNIWLAGNIGMGHLMLYNTPQSLHEELPFRSPVSKCTITADARIDNREELIAKLGYSGTEINNIPDSALILKAYELYGESCVDHLVGDFAFAIWDEEKQQLFCARDHIGIRPFFYYCDDSFFAFASEKKGLLAIEGVDQEVNDEYLMQILASLPAAEQTCYKHIYRLCGAHTIVVKNGNVRIKKYWELDAEKTTYYDDPDEYAKKLYELFEKAVRCRTRSIHNVGCELSGGFDSSAITCVAADILHKQGRPIATFALVTPEKERHPDPLDNEEHYIEEVNELVKADIIEKYVFDDAATDLLAQIDKELAVDEGPARCLVSWGDTLKSIAARYHIRTMLSGCMGDDLVTWWYGDYFYEHFREGRYLQFIKGAAREGKLAYALRRLVFINASRLAPWVFKDILKKRRIKQLKARRSNFLHHDHIDKVTQYIDEDMPRRLESFRELQKERVQIPFFSDRMEGELANARAYKMEMAYPMADIRLLQFVLSVPATEKEERRLFKKALAHKLPQSLLARKKDSPPLAFSANKWADKASRLAPWIETLNDLGTIIPFLDAGKFLKGYDLHDPRDVSKNINTIAIPKKKLTEPVVRWKQGCR